MIPRLGAAPSAPAAPPGSRFRRVRDRTAAAVLGGLLGGSLLAAAAAAGTGTAAPATAPGAPGATASAGGTAAPASGSFALFGPQSYVRQAGPPAFKTSTFAVPVAAPPYTLRLSDLAGPHHGNDQSSESDDGSKVKAIVTVNGTVVVRQDDFKHQVQEIDIPVKLGASNVLGVELLSDPGSGFTLTILGVDKTPPTIKAAVAPPPDAAGWNRAAVTVTFTCSDALSGVASCPPPVTVRTQGAGQVAKGTAFDKAGNQATATVTVNIDETPPVAAITAPAAGGFTDNPAPGLAGTWSDTLSGIDPASFHLTLDGANVSAAARVTAGGFTFTPAAPLTDGTHQVALTIADRAGNTATASAQFATDTTPPSLSFTAPTATILWNVSAPVVGLAYADGGSGVAPGTLQLTADGSPVTPPCQGGATGASCQLPALTTDVHTVVATIRDRAGNQASATISLDLAADTTPPVITFSLPVDGSALNGSALAAAGTPLVTARLLDMGSGIDPASVRLLVDGADQTAGAQTGPTSVSWSPPAALADGPHTAEVDARDLAGNAAQAVTRFTLDAQPPQLSVEQPVPGEPTASVTGIEVSYSDTGSGISPVSLLILLDGQSLTATCTAGAASASCPLPALAAGTHSLLVQIGDNAGNLAVASVQFGAPPDTVPPTLAITAPATPLVVGSATPNLSFGYSDAGSGVDLTTFAVTVDGADDTAQCNIGPSSATCSSPPLGRGAHAVTARIRDLAGNLTTTGANFTVVLPVTVAFTAPQAGLVTGTEVVQVTGTVAQQAVSVQVNGTPATLGNGTFSIPAFGLHEGTNDLVAVATDAAGNVGTATVRITADVTPPIVSITSPTDGDTVAAPTVTVSGLVNDLTLGTVNQTQATVTVNGVAATVANRGFAAAGVALSPGLNTLTAVAADRAGNQATATIHVTLAAAGSAPTLQIVSGDGQSATISTQLANPLTVRAADPAGAPLPGTQVVFQVIQGNGQLAGGKRSVLLATDAQGQASTTFTLGTRAGAGVNRVQVNAVHIDNQVTFTAAAATGAPAAIDVASGDNQRGLVAGDLSIPLTVVVTDAGHNVVAGAPVAFQVVAGGGSLGGAPAVTVTTDDSGLATARLTLGPLPGLDNNQVAASLPGVAAHPALLKASAFLPGDPAQTGIRGVVLDNQGAPVPGVTIRLRNSALTTQTDAQGRFVVGGAPVGQVFLIADATTTTLGGSWASLEYELFDLPGVLNALPKPIYLLPLDLAHGISVSETQGGTVTVPALPGFALDVAPGSVTFPDGTRAGTISVTAVHADKIPMAPGAGMQPRLIVTIQPAGARFNPPAAMTLPNLDALAPGSVTELFSFDHSLGAFVSVGTGTVSQDGSVIRSDPGFGVVQAGWHCGAPPSGSGDSASLSVSITNNAPILMDAPPDPSDPAASAGPAPQPITADGSPAQDTAYSWMLADPTVGALNPSGANLCPNSSSCTTAPTAAQAGDTQVTATLTCQTTGDTATDQKQVIAGAVKIITVFSEQQPDADLCNQLPPATAPPSAVEGPHNNPMLMATDASSVASISVQDQVTPNSAIPYMRIGVRQTGTTNLLDDQPSAAPDKTHLDFNAADGANLYEVVAGLDLNGNGQLDSNEITYVFPQKIRVFTVSDLKSAKGSAELHLGTLKALLFKFIPQFDALFLGDATTIPQAAPPVSVTAPASSMHHPLGAGWDSTCNASINQYNFGPGTDLAQAVSTSTPVINQVTQYFVKNQSAILQMIDSAGGNRVTITPNPPLSFSFGIGGVSDWGGPTDLALVYGGVGKVTMAITQFSVVKSQNGMGTRYRFTNLAFNGSFQDYFDFDYTFSKYFGLLNTASEATVEAGFPEPALFGAGGAIFSSMVSFSYDNAFPLILQGP